MKYIKNILCGALMGVGIGSIITLAMAYSYTNGYYPGVPSFLEKFSDIRTAVAIQFLVYALLGITQMMAGQLYKNINASQLFLRTIIHYFIVVISVVLAAWYLHWGPNTLGKIISMVAMITIIYFIIWIVEYLQIKRTIDKINRHL